MKSLRHLTAATAAVLLLSACLGSSSSPAEPTDPPVGGDIIRYNHLGLADFAVESLFHAGDSVWAAGSHGIYVSRNLDARNEDEANWQRQLDGYHFIHINGFDANTLFALGLPEGIDQAELYRSTDGGANWSLIKHNFGTQGDIAESSITRLLPDTETGYLYAVGADLLAVSYDQGNSWEALSGEPGLIARNFALSLHPERSHLWWGGQNAIEQLLLHRFSLIDNEHESWQMLFPSPSTVEDIVFDRTNPDRVFIGAEGGIALSENYGNDWQTVLSPDHHIFYMAIVQSHRFPEVWYSARWEKSNEEHQLTFKYSDDRGHTWQRSIHPPRAGHEGMRDMVLLRSAQDGQDVLWLGLQSGIWNGGGIMRVGVDLQAFN